jgi:hypothetical protein
VRFCTPVGWPILSRDRARSRSQVHLSGINPGRHEEASRLDRLRHALPASDATATPPASSTGSAPAWTRSGSGGGCGATIFGTVRHGHDFDAAGRLPVQRVAALDQADRTAVLRAVAPDGVDRIVEV